MPKTRLGKWSARLIAAFFLFLLAFHLLIASGQQRGEAFFDNPVLSVTGLAAWLSGVAAFFTGLTSIIKKKERSVMVFLATLLGLLIIILILGEIFWEH